MKKNVLFKNFSILMLLLFAGFVLKAQPILVENFEYPVGTLLSANGYTSHSGTANFITVTAPTINYAGYASSGIGNEVTMVNTGEDVHKTFTPPTADVVYASFLVNVSSAATTTGDYFFHLGQTVLGTTYRGRVFVMKDANEKIAFGIAQSITAGANYSAFNYDLNTTYLIVLKFSIVAGESNDVSSIYINPALGAPEPSTGWVSNTDVSSTDLTEVGAFALRQGGSASGPYLKIDGIRIATAWSDIVGGASVPSISASPNTLNGFTYVAGSGPSAEQNFTLSGSNLSAAISLAAPASYEISLGTGAGFVATNPIVVNHVGGTVSARPIYVRLKAGLSANTYDESINITSTGATTKTVMCNGSVIGAVVEPANHVTSFVANGTSAAQIALSWTDAVPAADGYLIKGSATSFSAIVAPVDGVVEANGVLVQNIAAGVGLHTFEGLEGSTTYYFKIFPYNGVGTFINYKVNGTVPQASTATLGTPILTEIILPQYIQGNTPSNNDRIPYAYRVQLSNLAPNTTYRYINQAVTSADAGTVSGAGNVIYVNSDNTFIRTSSASFSTPGAYGEFTTNATGSFTGWFITEATGNARFAPGNEVFFRIRLNDGNQGTTAVTYLTTTSITKVVAYGNEANVLQGTAIRGTSTFAPKNFALLYDNVEGQGRPIFATSVEATGVDFVSVTSIAEFYRAFVAGVNGAWGGIIPNMNANGIRKVEERSLASGAIQQFLTSPNGVWGATDTRNPLGGITNVLVLDLSVTNDPFLNVTPANLTGFTYVQGSGPSDSQSYNISGQFLTGSGNITITAPANYEIATGTGSYGTSLSLPFTGGTITNQPVAINVRLKAGLSVGLYNGETINNTGGGALAKTVTCSGEVVSGLVPAILSEKVPQYIQGINGANNNRLPFAFWLNIGNLQPNTTYRFINQAVVATDTPTTSGAGNVIYVNTSGDFTRTSSASFSDPGGYGTLATDATGSYSGWFITEATGNVRFTPGNEIFFRLRLNDGNEGTVAVTYLTTTNFAKVIDFGNTASATEGTGLRIISGDSPKSFAVLYDNVAGTGRPIYATSVEAVGIDYTAITSYAPYYRDFVSGVNGSWGGILPNMNANGIKNMSIVNTVTSETKTYSSNDGMWGTVDTRNPSGGLSEVLVIDLILIGVNEPVATIGKAFATQNELNITLLNDQRTQIEIVNLLGQSMLQTILEGSNNYVITHQLKSGAYLLRISNEQGSLLQKFIIR